MYSCTCFNKWLHMNLIFQATLGVAWDFCTLVVEVEVCQGVGGLKRNKDTHRILINQSIYRCFWRIPVDNSLFVEVPQKKMEGARGHASNFHFTDNWINDLSLSITHTHTNPHGGGGGLTKIASPRLIVILYIVHLHTPAMIFTQIK